MAVTTTHPYDNPQVPGMVAYDYLPDQLIADPKNLVSQPIVLMTGVLKRGTVLGQQTSSSINAVPGTNTGTGTVTAITPGAGQEFGSYVLTATDATHFSVTDPEGVVIGTATVGQAFASAEVNFTITAGGTAFVAGDSFRLTSSISTGNYVACVKTANDGSQVPVGILVDDVDASAGPVRTAIYVAGEFNQRAAIFDASWSLPLITTALRQFGIFLKDSVSAADPF